MLHSRTLGRGPELVLLHGWGMNAAVWDEVAEALAGELHCTLIDLPGHGASPWEEGPIEGLAGWAQACLEAAPERALWVGWSLGGSIALEAALTAPQRLRGLLLVTATPRFVRGPSWPHAMPEETLVRFRDALGTGPQATLEQFLCLQVRGSDRAREVLRSLRRGLARWPPPSPEALDAGLGLLREVDLRARLGGLRVPSLWLYGGRDTLVPRGGAESLAALLPAARVERIEGAAHAPFLSHREESLELLRRFAEGLP
jgi:pimeloyl-[acyl-carrier protein] methyl ester esterase